MDRPDTPICDALSELLMFEEESARKENGCYWGYQSGYGIQPNETYFKDRLAIEALLREALGAER